MNINVLLKLTKPVSNKAGRKFSQAVKFSLEKQELEKNSELESILKWGLNLGKDDQHQYS
jgi:hypothetical protein